MYYSTANTKLSTGKILLLTLTCIIIFIFVAIVCELLTSFIKFPPLKIVIRELFLRAPLTVFSLHLFAKRVIKLYNPGIIYQTPVLVNLLKWLGVGLFLPILIWSFYGLFQLIVPYQRTTIISFSDQFWLIVKWSAISIGAGITEEVLFRGHLFFLIKSRFKNYIAVIIVSLVFGLVHIAMLPSFGFFNIAIVVLGGFLVSIMFSMIVIRTKVIWYAVVVHVLWDVFFIGKITTIAMSQTDANEAILAFKLTTRNLLLTGGSFGIEVALPCLIIYVVVAACLYNRPHVA